MTSHAVYIFTQWIEIGLVLFFIGAAIDAIRFRGTR